MSSDGARTWDGPSYHRVSGPMEEMARAVLDRLALRGDESVLDVGCGTGRVTAVLVERLPRGRVVALDASPSMVEVARSTLGPDVEVRLGDVLELEPERSCDAVFSTATFHWVLDHDRLFPRLAGALAPGGRLVAQCGGAGNTPALIEATNRVAGRPRYAPAFAGWERPHLYATPEATLARLERSGFVDGRCWLQPWPVRPEEPIEYLSTVTCGPQVQRLRPEDRAPFLEAVAELLPSPLTVDYVRLNIDARLP